MKDFNEPCSMDCLSLIGCRAYYGTPGSKKYVSKNFFQGFTFFFINGIKKWLLFFYKIVPVILLLLNADAVRAQQDVNYALHANIIYRFTKYIDWPDNNNSGEFIIGIIGDTPLYNELADFTENKTVGNRKIVIKKMSPSASSFDCNMLFISEDKSRNLKKISEITKGSPILIVSETNASLTGSCINFVTVNEHLKLEINKTNIEERNLNIASELLRLGTVVK